MKEAERKVIVITGASAGVGRAIAIQLAKEGYKIALIARGEEKLKSTKLEVELLGGQAEYYLADVSDSNALDEAASLIEDELGPIDVWINNAMVTVLGPVTELPLEEIKRVTEVTYLGSVNGIITASKRMVPRNQGHIIQIGSALAFQSIPLQSAYCGAKHAIRGFLQSFRIELMHGKNKVELSEIHLPAVNTPQFGWMKNHMPFHPRPAGKIYQPEVVAEAVSYVVKHPRREFWIGGGAVKAIVASKFFPQIAEKYLSLKGIKGQRSKNLNPTSESNLLFPVEHDYGVHGKFSREASKSSLQVKLNEHRKSLFILLVTLFTATFMRKKFGRIGI
jgi:short-subunit dehydrogenase